MMLIEKSKKKIILSKFKQNKMSCFQKIKKRKAKKYTDFTPISINFFCK